MEFAFHSEVTKFLPDGRLSKSWTNAHDLTGQVDISCVPGDTMHVIRCTTDVGHIFLLGPSQGRALGSQRPGRAYQGRQTHITPSPARDTSATAPHQTKVTSTTWCLPSAAPQPHWGWWCPTVFFLENSSHPSVEPYFQCYRAWRTHSSRI